MRRSRSRSRSSNTTTSSSSSNKRDIPARSLILFRQVVKII